jgi:hypothetical protein
MFIPHKRRYTSLRLHGVRCQKAIIVEYTRYVIYDIYAMLTAKYSRSEFSTRLLRVSYHVIFEFQIQYFPLKPRDSHIWSKICGSGGVEVVRV